MNNSRQAGFTLLEIIIVTGLLAVLAALLIPRLSGKNHEIKGVIRQIAVLSRDIRNNAKLKNATYRLVIDMKKAANGDDREDSFWVESANGMVIGSQFAEEEEKAEKEGKDKKPPAQFQPDTKLLKKPVRLPSGMTFSKVELASAKEPFTEGRVYLYYLPQGYVEESVIQLSYGEDLKWTVAIQPLTGKADVVNEHIDLNKIRQEK